MKRTVGILTSLMLFFLPLSTGALAYTHRVTHQSVDSTLRYTWNGGMVGHYWPQMRFIPKKVEGKTFAEIMGIADQEATVTGFPVKYVSEDGTMIYEAYPGFDKSKCEDIKERGWQDTKLIIKNTKDVCK